jgi:23S rRNA pseudouridine1911/1915/1917 synthase
VVHPARGHRSGTLAQAIDGGLLVHRLDRDTSGLLVVAKDEPTHNALKEALQRREITREYLALVEGRPPARSGTVDAPIGRDRRSRTRMSTDTDTPRAARTHFAIERTLPAHTLLRVTLETGRTHQIRVHLEAIGFPVVGDPEYGGAAVTREALGLDRQFLHAARLAFDHPHTGERIDVASPLPPDLEQALERAAGEV